MDILELKAAYEWFLLRACFAALVALIATLVCLKVYEHIGRLKVEAKRYGWPLVALFIAYSAWATYTAFPTQEEKEAYRRYLNGQAVTNSVWAGIYAPGNLPASKNTTHSTESNGANDSHQNDTNGTETNVSADSETADNEETESGNNYEDGHSLTLEDFARGFVLTRIGTNEVHDFNAPEGAIINQDWLAFGAAEDWEYSSTDGWSFLLGTNEVERLRVFSCGEVLPIPSSTNTYFAPFKTLLGIVPTRNWHLLDETNRPSQFWYQITSLNSLKLTWQNALYGRETNAPASFQMELWPNGNFTYRYDLTRASLWNGEAVTNILIGAAYEGLVESVDVSALTNLTSLTFYRLDSSDTPRSDRDRDGLIIEDELFVYHTDPNSKDSDYDGFSDGDEVASGSNPASRDSDGDGLVDGSDPDPMTETSLADADQDGIPDAYENHWFGEINAIEALMERDETGFDLNGKILGGINPTNAAFEAEVVTTNEFVSWKLFNAFAADWPQGRTNLIWERTFAIGRTSAWQQFFLSASPTNAASWHLLGMELEWETDEGSSGVLKASPLGDSFRIPLSTNEVPYALTLRLRATGAHTVYSPTPIYLIAYIPEFSVKGGKEIIGESGQKFQVFTDGSESVIHLSINHSKRPCKAPAGEDECDMFMFDQMSEYNPDFSFIGDMTGGTINVSRPGALDFPDISLGVQTLSTFRRTRRGIGGGAIVVLDPSASWGCNGHGCGYDGLGYDWGGYYYEEDTYPLDSKCLRKSWYRSYGGDYYDGDCEVTVTAGTDSGYVTTDVKDDTGYVYVDGVEVWSDSPEHTYDDTGCGGGYSEDYLGNGCDSCETDCANGNCDSSEGPDLGSLKFRIPLGNPVKGQFAGFVWFSTDYPIWISRSMFYILEHPSATISDTTSYGVRRIVSADQRGRDVRIQNISNGVNITIYENDTGKLEHTWEITNVDGDSARVRLRKISRQNNVMQDETYTYNEDGDWIRFDNIAGIGTQLYIEDDFYDYGDGVKRETLETTDANGNVLKRVTTEKTRIGECENAVMREIYREETTGRNIVYTYADYWNDPSHSSRHGQPRLVRGNARAWVYTDFDEKGHETLRVEQRGNAEMPWDNFPYVVSNVLYNASPLENAFVTIKDYAPFDGDDCHRDDAAKARQETRYVVVNGTATVIGRTWTRYTRLMRNGYEAIKKEMWQASAPETSRTALGNLYTYEITYSNTGTSTPLLMRGAVVESLDENGVLTKNTYLHTGSTLIQTSRKSFDGIPHQTYTVTEQDATYGAVLRRSERLTVNDVIISDEQSTYDEKNRLRSTTYLDGTFTTNAYSCCRLLWRQTREGRKILRSAKTGTDHLYNAEEDVWLGEIGNREEGIGNGFRVTQHFFDGLGRETNTVVYVGASPGEAVEVSASGGKAYSSAKTEYPYGGSDYAVRTDERGKVKISRTDILWDAMETGEAIFTNSIEVIKTKNRTYFGGGSSSRREWNGNKWTTERRFTEYAEDGKRIEYVVTESSDCGVVTNSVSVYDLLGRVIEEQDTIGLASYAYDGSSSRILEQTRICENIVRVAQFIYDSHGEQVGVLQDGITSRSDITYDVDSSNIAWRVTTDRVFGEGTNSCIVTRERLTGLSDECRSQITRSDLSGAWTRITKSFDSTLGLETETTEASSNGTTTLLKKNGLTIGSIASSGRTYNEYDSFGRVSFVSRTIGNSEVKPYQAFEYTPSGDVASIHTFTNGTDVICESYLHDMLGNKVATTDALGNTIYKSYDPFGNVLAEWGATYPVRYTYDTQNRRTSLATTRDGETWDTTTWSYDAEKGRCLSKTYADGSQVLYTYTPDNLLLRTTYPSGRWTENVYNAKREIVEMLSSDGAHNATMVRDEFGRVVSESNNVASSLYSLHDQFGATNQMDNIDGVSAWFVREFDQNGRLIRFERVGGECVQYVFATNGTLATVSNNAVGAVYSYTDDLLDAGYGFAIQGGTAFSREICRDTYLRDNILAVTNRHGGMIRGVAYSYDELQRPVLRNDDAFGYNSRGEVVFSRGDAKNAEYLYDHIGNLLSDSSVSITNAYTANNLNQYASILRASASPREINLQYDLDGNKTQHDDWIYTYDSACRLTSVSSNNIIVASFAYDAQGRRVKKITATATYRYFYDGLLLSYEHITQHDGSIAEIDYVWGKDISGTRDGACGIGGLLYLKRNGSIYIPFFDAYGNVLGYTDAHGNVVAEYVYDAFGGLVCKSGAMADEFALRFSTKYYDSETDLYYYIYRYYKPQLMRWLTEDPIAEDGGLNLYGFCGNNPVCRYDKDGRAYFAKRALAGQSWNEKFSINARLDAMELEWSHEHLFYGTPDKPLDDVGYFGDGKVRSDKARDESKYIVTSSGYNDCVMKKAQAKVTPKRYCVILGALPWFDNCQSYAAKLRAMYDELLQDERVLCECFGKRKIGGTIWVR